MGCVVLDVAGNHLGTVTDVTSNPAQDLLVIDLASVYPDLKHKRLRGRLVKQKKLWILEFAGGRIENHVIGSGKSVAAAAEFHNVVGAQPPDYSKSPYTGLALGHDLALLWKEQ